MKQFDYKHLTASVLSGVSKMMTEIRKPGKEGWELVSVCPTAEATVKRLVFILLILTCSLLCNSASHPPGVQFG